MSADPTPNAEERAKDERDLAYLSLWDQGLSISDIGAQFGVARGVPLGTVHRVHDADPTALIRKPAKKKGAPCRI